jgi:hypothetical protein
VRTAPLATLLRNFKREAASQHCVAPTVRDIRDIAAATATVSSNSTAASLLTRAPSQWLRTCNVCVSFLPVLVRLAVVWCRCVSLRGFRVRCRF